MFGTVTRNINADFLHYFDRFRMNVAGRHGPGAASVQQISGGLAQDAFGHMTAAGIPRAENENSWFHQQPGPPQHTSSFVRQASLARQSVRLVPRRNDITPFAALASSTGNCEISSASISTIGSSSPRIDAARSRISASFPAVMRYSTPSAYPCLKRTRRNVSNYSATIHKRLIHAAYFGDVSMCDRRWAERRKVRARDQGGIGRTPMCENRLAGPNRTGFPGVVTERDNEIEGRHPRTRSTTCCRRPKRRS